jgi:DNA-binding transcriptional LysR family regulator
MPFGYTARVELRHLRYFVAVAELTNVIKAAGKLRVAQPALSRQIRNLEDELGVPLLERTSRGVTLTEAGKVFATEARDILARVGAAIKSARAAARGESGELHLGYAPSPTAELLPRTLHAFQNAAPGVRLVLHDNSTGEMLGGLRDGTLHVALLVRPDEDSLCDLNFETLITYPMCVAVGPAHPLARKPSVSLKQLLEEKLVAYARSDYGEYHSLLEKLFAPVGRVPDIAEECDSGPSLIAAVEALRGVALVPGVIRCLAGGRLKLRPLRPAPAPLEVGFAYPSRQTTPAARRLIQTLRSLRSIP